MPWDSNPLWDLQHSAVVTVIMPCAFSLCFPLLIMPKTARSSSTEGPIDVMQYSLQQLTRLPAEVLRLHLSSRHLVTTGTKVVMASRLYDALHHTTLSPTPSSSTATANNTPSSTAPVSSQGSVSLTSPSFTGPG